MKDLMTPEELAKELGVSKQTTADWRYRGIGPEFVRIGPRTVRYMRADVESFLERNRMRRTDTPVPVAALTTATTGESPTRGRPT